MRNSLPTILAVALLVGAGLAMADLRRQESHTLVVYTTPALKDVLEKDVFPRYHAATGERVEPVYVAAGEQYNRLRLSGAYPEADVFLHASPLYIEKGYEEGYFEAFDVPEAATWNDTFRGRAVPGGHVWYAFGWSPLVEVYSPALGAPPDLATSDVRYGLADPLLSNNGIYTALYFERLDPRAGDRAIAHTTQQPVTAASNIAGITDGSFDVTLGYEGVALLYEGKGARIGHALPILEGQTSVLPVVMSVGLVKPHTHPDALRFIRFLFSNETQAGLGKNFLRPVQPGAADPEAALDLAGARPIDHDWARWRDLESALPKYVVKT